MNRHGTRQARAYRFDHALLEAVSDALALVDVDTDALAQHELHGGGVTEAHDNLSTGSRRVSDTKIPGQQTETVSFLAKTRFSEHTLRMR